MITSVKLNLLFLPLFVSILLSIAVNLKVGQDLDSLFYTLLSPITTPTTKLRLFTESRIGFLKNISGLERQTHEQKRQIAGLLSENEYLKQLITDKKILDGFKNSYTQIVPVRISGATGKYIVSSSFPVDQVRPGQPLVSDNVLLGTVLEVKGASISVIPIDSEKSPSFPIRTSSGQKGIYQYLNNQPQIIDIPSQFPIVLGDFVFTEPGELFPGNLVVGKTIRITTISQEPLQKAEISLYDTLSNNPTNLAIITKP